MSGLTSGRNRGNAGRGLLISSFGVGGSITLVAGNIPAVGELMTGILASGELARVWFNCCRVTIVAIRSESSDPELTVVKSVVFDESEKSFLCPGGKGSVEGTPVRSVKGLTKRKVDEPEKTHCQ